MGNLLHTRQRIAELLGIFAYQAKAASAAGHTDFNKVSEDVLVPLFKLIFNLPDLKNLNTEVKKNFPGIDLADDKARVAFQVTATSDSQKLKEALSTFIKKGFYQKYSRFAFYIITEKKNSYPEKAFAEIIQGKFEFNIAKDILDFRDLIRTCNQFQLDKASKIMRILEANFGRGDYSVFSEKQTEPFEDVHLNLVEISFPKKLYTADLLIDRAEIVRSARGALKMKDPTRAIIRHYIIEQLKLDFFSGWHLHGNQLITFRNLRDEVTFLSKVIDEGSVEPIDTESFYTVHGQIDEDKERSFKALLRKTLQEQLYKQNVEWQFEEGLFIFIDNGQEEKTTKTVNRKKDDIVVQEELIIYKRYERWMGEKESERAVLERFMKTETPDEVWYCKHRAFEAKFKRIDKKWFLLILPDWFFSYDGFHKSQFHAKDLKWLKKKANTGIVFTDFRFILFFLKHTENGFFQTNKTEYPLRYDDIVSFENAPFLYDEAWNPPEEKQRRKPDTETEVSSENLPGQDGLFDS